MNTCAAHRARFSNPPPCKRNRAARMPCDPARSTPPMSDTAAHVLILDDDIDVACAAELLLRRRHGQVATLNDPAQLASLLASRVPDVVLLDLNFTPGRIDGAEGLAVLDLLRAQAFPPAVIALTAYADVPLAVEALKRGASDFITKPWDNARLIAAVDSALARRADRGQCDGAGRERRRQGAGGARHPSCIAPRCRQAAGGGYGRAAGIDFRERVVRPPQRLVHRCPQRPRRTLSGRARRLAVPR